MPSKLVNMRAKAETASVRKGKLGLDPKVSYELRETLLEINKVALLMFDVLEEDMISQQDIYRMLTLPLLINKFSLTMEAHAKDQIAKGPVAEKTAY